MGEVAHVNANDGTCEGMEYKRLELLHRPVPPRSQRRPQGHRDFCSTALLTRQCSEGGTLKCLRTPDIKKVLVIGSGPIVIGQAAEFDYAGTQACRVLKEEGVETVLLNSNPATIMTDQRHGRRMSISSLMTIEVVEQHHRHGEARQRAARPWAARRA